MSDMQTAARWAAEAKSVVVLSGAGMSAESSVPTFRDAQTGIWERFSPEDLATEEAFRNHPSMVWTWYVWRAMLVRGALPNAGHEAVGIWQRRLAAKSGSLTVATQNVDDLHERGDASDVLHLHGSLHNFRCLDCGQTVDFDPSQTGVIPGATFDHNNLLTPVACPHCDTGMLRPGVVWFGEMLPECAFDRAVEALRAADLVVVVGTSGLVQPAASLPFIGQEAGARLIEINPVSTALSKTADLYLSSTAAVALPQLLESIR